MRRFSAQYIITNTGTPLKRAVITTEDDGSVISIDDTGGKLSESNSVEFYNGIIVPGFVNCHCHLELSHMKGKIAPGGGLAVFLEQVRNTREETTDKIISGAREASNDQYKSGTVACADICNNDSTFVLKEKSEIEYYNFIEVFGIDKGKAKKRLDEIINIAGIAEEKQLSNSLVPHSAYSMSITLFDLLKKESEKNAVTSIHFMETAGEDTLLRNHSGPLFNYYKESGLMPAVLDTVSDHVDAIMNRITPSGNLILVHNTFVNRETIRSVKKRDNLFWCLCPRSNLYIENQVPPIKMLLEENCEIVIGTDSLASNYNLNILEELQTIQLYFPLLAIEDLIAWATINGARALKKEDHLGKIEPRKKPGLLVLENIDLHNMKLLQNSTVKRLI